MIINVHYVLEVDEKQWKRILRAAEDYRMDYNDAGPMLSAQRLFESIGINGVCEELKEVGLKVTHRGT